MELVKSQQALEFKWQDVTFQVRSTGTAEDRFAIDILYDVDKNNQVNVPRKEVYLTLIERFVTGWSGVTVDGQPVAFTIQNLGNLPADPKEDIILLLGAFIFKHCGLWPDAEEAARKNV